MIGVEVPGNWWDNFEMADSSLGRKLPQEEQGDQYAAQGSEATRDEGAYGLERPACGRGMEGAWVELGHSIRLDMAMESARKI